MKYHVTIGARTLVVEVKRGLVRVEGRDLRVDLGRLEGSAARSLLVDGVSHPLVVHGEGAGRWDLQVRGRRMRALVMDERTRAIHAMTRVRSAPSGPRPIVAPMPGMVVRVEVLEGDVVQAGQGVVIVEAMKMENELRCDGAGVVTRVHVRPGEAVEKGQMLVELAPATVEAT